MPGRNVHPGPVDGSIKKLTDLLFRYRGKPLSTLKPEEKKDLRNAVADLDKFTVTVGVFATSDIQMIDVVFRNILEGFRARIAFMDGKWVRSVVWLLDQMSRDLNSSGRLYVEVRRRIEYLTQAGVVNSTELPDGLKRKAEQIAESIKPLLDANRANVSCQLAGHKKKPRINSLCSKGCDILLLKELQFHEATIGEIMGFARNTAANRVTSCENVWRPLR